MIEIRQRRAWLMVAAIAIAVTLVLMLVPQGHAHGGTTWLAILPVLFIGLITPLCASPVPECFNSGRASDAPAFEPAFQRPPPLSIA